MNDINVFGVERTGASTTADFRVKDSFIINALRNCGYTVYTALADIADNSIEPEVESNNVWFDYDYEKTNKGPIITGIYLIDDGNGMPMDILQEAMCLGSETGKNGEDNLGLYGAGLKAAALSIGQDLEVITKTPDGNLNYARLSIADAIKGTGKISLQFDTFDTNSNEYAWFKEKTKSTHGTIVKISNLDKLTCKTPRTFEETLTKRIGTYFNKFIKANTFNFYVRNNKVPYYDLMDENVGSVKLGEEDFIIDGHKISCVFWYVKPFETRPLDTPFEDKDGHMHLGRDSKTQGFYVYRNNRLVGYNLTFGLFERHMDANGFRCELFVDGSCDYMFGSTFTKIVTDKESSEMLQSFKDKLETVSKPYKLDTSRRERKRREDENKLSPEEAKKRQEFLDMIANELNKDNRLKVPRFGVNNPGDGNKEHQTRGPQEHPNPVRKRQEKWFKGFVERYEGECGEMYYTEGNGTIVINKSHKFYEEFFSKLNPTNQASMLKMIAGEEAAKRKCDYYFDDDIRSNIDDFTIQKSLFSRIVLSK